jgi:hypothetical protein
MNSFRKGHLMQLVCPSNRQHLNERISPSSKGVVANGALSASGSDLPHDEQRPSFLLCWIALPQ